MKFRDIYFFLGTLCFLITTLIDKYIVEVRTTGRLITLVIAVGFFIKYFLDIVKERYHKDDNK